MKCPICNQYSARKDVRTIRRTKQGIEKQCPRCKGWLKGDPKMTKVKNVAILGILLFNVIAVFTVDPSLRNILSSLGLASAFVAILALFRTQMVVAEMPKVMEGQSEDQNPASENQEDNKDA